MPKPVALPSGWERTFERSHFGSFIDREYTRIGFVHPSTGQKVIINDVQEPNGLGGWGHLVHVIGPEYGELDLVDVLQTAREVAYEFMEKHPN